ncbi:MAG: YibE/F family protein [Actinomycetota bacterium]|nr:YibE/F family protein [Actinomycetota bacterium]
MGHSHHGVSDDAIPPSTRRTLHVALLPFAVATAIGLALLWPGADGPDLGATGLPSEEYDASVTRVTPIDCPEVPGQERFVCSEVTVELREGEDEGETFTFDYSAGPRTRSIRAGDDVVVATAGGAQVDVPPGAATPPKYFFVDFDRRLPLLALAVAFALVVIALSRWRGLAALAGLAVSLTVLVRFVLPAILEGSDPLAVALVGGATIMFLALYLAHGLNAATTTAVFGTLASLLLTGLLAVLFVELAAFTGAGSEEAVFLQINQQQVNLEGLLLASIVIGTLGVLDDVTVTQAAAVWELHRANPRYGIRNLYRSGIRIGRDHIASTVNTLVLAYAGASLPLLILFSVSNRPLTQVVNTETVAEEVVRTLVGSIGLVASVPITTALAAWVVTSGRRAEPEPESENGQEGPEYVAPRREREFRDGT